MGASHEKTHPVRVPARENPQLSAAVFLSPPLLHLFFSAVRVGVSTVEIEHGYFL